MAIFCGLAGVAFGLAPPADSDLPPDPAVRYGALSNGVHYALRPGTPPGGHLSLRLIVAAGSLDETEAERGLAHFVEHLAFNGSTHYPPGTLVELLQRQGMAFGADTNATTTFDRTVYTLELPHNDRAAMAEGIGIFRDFAGGLTFPPDKIEQERAVIQSERRARDSVLAREQERQIAFAFAGTLLADRPPIGDSEVVQHADRAALRSFYDAWYRPERMTIVVAGDFDPAAMTAEIKAQFGHFRAHGRARPVPAFGRIAPPGPAPRCTWISEPEAAGTLVSLTVLRQEPPPPDTAAARIQELPLQLAMLMFNRRLSASGSDGFSQAGAVARAHLGRFHETSLTLSCPASDWRRALAAGEDRLRRALQFGFQADELQTAAAVFRGQLEQAARVQGNRPARLLANAMVEALSDQRVLLTPADELSIVSPALAQMSAAACSAAFRDAWGSQPPLILVTGNARIAGAAPAEIAAVYRQANRPALAGGATAPLAFAPVWPFTDFGPAGRIERRSADPAAAAVLVRFANGARVNLKRTSTERHRIRVLLRIAGGRNALTPERAGVAELAEPLLRSSGLGDLGAADLTRILSGHEVSLDFAVQDDALEFRGLTDSEDLPLQLQLMAATLGQSRFAEADAAAARTRVAGQYVQWAHSVDGPLDTIVARELAGGDLRFGHPPLRAVMRADTAMVSAWLRRQFAAGTLELTLVGDLDPDAALAAVAQTLGALPARTRAEAPPPPAPRFPPPPQRWSFTVSTPVTAAAAAAYWPVTGARSFARRDRFEFLGAVLLDRLRLRLREQLGETYTPTVTMVAPLSAPDFAYLAARATVDPGRMDAALDAMLAAAHDLAARGVGGDEFVRARAPLLERAAAEQQANSYWLQALARAQSDPDSLAEAAGRPADLARITPQELSALAATIFAPRQIYTAVCRPGP